MSGSDLRGTLEPFAASITSELVQDALSRRTSRVESREGIAELTRADRVSLSVPALTIARPPPGVATSVGL